MRGCGTPVEEYTTQHEVEGIGKGMFREASWRSEQLTFKGK